MGQCMDPSQLVSCVSGWCLQSWQGHKLLCDLGQDPFSPFGFPNCKRELALPQGSLTMPPNPDPLYDSCLPPLSWEKGTSLKILIWSRFHQKSTEPAGTPLPVCAGMFQAHPEGLSAPEPALSLTPGQAKEGCCP